MDRSAPTGESHVVKDVFTPPGQTAWVVIIAHNDIGADEVLAKPTPSSRDRLTPDASPGCLLAGR